MTIDDLAICYGEVEEIDYNDYLSILTTGLFTTMGRWAKGSYRSSSELNQKLLSIVRVPCKHLYILKGQDEFLKELDGKVYGITDVNGMTICDVLEEEMLFLDDQDIISDGQLTTPDALEYVRSQRVEIIILNK